MEGECPFVKTKGNNPGKRNKGEPFIGVHQSGKRKMEYVEDGKDRAITFYKRKKGLFKSAWEISQKTKCEVFLFLRNKDSGNGYYWGTEGIKNHFIPNSSASESPEITIVNETDASYPSPVKGHPKVTSLQETPTAEIENVPTTSGNVELELDVMVDENFNIILPDVPVTKKPCNPVNKSKKKALTSMCDVKIETFEIGRFYASYHPTARGNKLLDLGFFVGKVIEVDENDVKIQYLYRESIGSKAADWLFKWPKGDECKYEYIEKSAFFDGPMEICGDVWDGYSFPNLMDAIEKYKFVQKMYNSK